MNNEFLKINMTTGCGSVSHPPYYFAERLGVDSVAFVLERMTKEGDYDSYEYGLIREYKPPIADFIVSAFGGSLDKPLTPLETVIEECREEAGFIVEARDITYCGKRFVSTQMNQFCHLYSIDVSLLPQGKREPQTYLEAQASVVWLKADEIDNLEFLDWKAQVIIFSSER